MLPKATAGHEPEEEEGGYTLADYLGLARRRFWYFLVPVVLGVAIAATVAYTIPAVYRSSATILIERQQIPIDLVRSTVTSYADQRIQNIKQRVMTTAKLEPLIEKYDLYREEREARSVAAAIRVMRKDVHLDMLNANVVDPKSGQAKKATIAFTLAYDHGSPATAQKVTNEFVTLFLDENLKRRRAAAEATSSFLEAEADRLAAQISDQEAKVARFKEEHSDRLPDMQGVNTQMLSRIEDQLEQNKLELRLREERLQYLEVELARTSPFGPDITDVSNRVRTPQERLMELEVERIELSSRFHDGHPDLVDVRREIAALRAVTGGLDPDRIERLLESARTSLAEQREIYRDGHPDVESAKRQVAALEQQLQEAREAVADSEHQDLANPLYDQLRSQLAAARAEVLHLRETRARLTDKLAEHEERVLEGPTIEREYRAVTRDYNNALAKYSEVKNKQMEAELAESLESERKGERFVLVEPPVVPGEPFKPNRLQILFLGFAFSFGAGFAVVVVREMMDGTVHTARDIMVSTGSSPMTVIPYFELDEEVAGRGRWVVWAGATAVMLLVAGLAAVHVLVKPLDLAAYHALQQVGFLQTGVN